MFRGNLGTTKPYKMIRFYSTRNFFLTVLILTTTVFINGCSKGGSSNPTPKASVTITSLSVMQGSYYATVIINGTGFDPDFNNDIVAFNGKPATVSLGGTTTKMYVQVPLAAGTGNVTVTVNGVTATGPVFTSIPALIVTTFAGNISSYGNTNGTGAAASFNQSKGIAIDKSGNLYVADKLNNVIRKITPQAVVTTFAGTGKQGRADGTTATATFEGPTGVAIDQSGNLFVVDAGLLREISTAGNITTMSLGIQVSDQGVAVDASNNLYVIDNQGRVIDKVNSNGTLTPITGNFTSFLAPFGLTFDKNGNLFVTDAEAVWKVTIPSNAVSFWGSSNNTVGFNFPGGITSDQSGNLYVADTDNSLIKKISPDGTISVLAGGGESSPQEVNGVANSATFLFPVGVAVDASGNVFATEGNLIREITFQ
jgi:sugar lactone lactonase YvrE